MNEGVVKAEAGEPCGAQGVVQGVSVMSVQRNIDRQTQVLRTRGAADAGIVQAATMSREYTHGPCDRAARGL